MTLPHLRQIYPGWWLASGVTVVMGMVALMSVWTYGIYLAPLQSEFGWSQTTIGAAFGVTFAISGLASILVGRLVDAFGPRRVMIIGTAVTTVAYLLFSQVQELWQFLAVLTVLAFFQVWTFYIPLTSLVTRWFSRRRATAMAIATSGFGVGGLVFLPAMVGIVSIAGWRESLILAAAVTVAINGVFLLIFTNDPGGAWARYDECGEAALQSEEHGVAALGSARELLRTRLFWLLALGFAMFYMGEWAFVFHSLPFFESRGASAGEAAVIMSAAAGFGIVLRICSGFVIDRVKILEQLAAAVLLAMSVAMLLLLVNGSLATLALFLVLWGVGSSIGPLLQPLLMVKLFGTRHYATAYGISDGMDTAGVIAGTWLGVLLIDVTGSYTPVLAVYAVAFLVGSLALAGLSVAVSATSHRHREVSAPGALA